MTKEEKYISQFWNCVEFAVGNQEESVRGIILALYIQRLPMVRCVRERCISFAPSI